MRAFIASILRHWPALAFVTSAAMLAIAHAFETLGHLAPCTLCLYERQVYWLALPVAALAFIATEDDAFAQAAAGAARAAASTRERHRDPGG